MNRGSVPGRFGRDESHPRASMRPRFMNRGSERTVSLQTDNATRFNEAPIHESGKSRISTSPCPSTWSFNEAPIHESGKS